jgi:hypothetical protein
MAGTAFAKNSTWSMLSLLNIWGPDVTPEQEQRLADMVVNRFNEIAQAHGSTVTWYPHVSEVIGEVYGEGNRMWEEKRSDGGQTTDEDLYAWREQASEEIWQAFCDNTKDESLRKKIDEILEGDVADE